MPAMRNHYYTIARIYHIVGEFSKAIEFYQYSLDKIPYKQSNRQKFLSYLHLGICYHALSQHSAAKQAIELAYELKPDDRQATTWLEKLQKLDETTT
ncbi:MAG: hypothetical protein GY782_11790 [Gammaproteobacteria bacterium]|nr:hypothetical protein [Gammaproteobacteria bacterium]